MPPGPIVLFHSGEIADSGSSGSNSWLLFVDLGGGLFGTCVLTASGGFSFTGLKLGINFSAIFSFSLEAVGC